MTIKKEDYVKDFNPEKYESYRLKTVAIDQDGNILKPAEWRDMPGDGKVFIFKPSLERKK